MRKHDQKPSADKPSGLVLRVLVVDDEELIRSVVRSVLQCDGHHVVVAESADEGLRQLSAQSFDLVLSDVNMPLMDGIQLRMEAQKLSINPRFGYMTGGPQSSELLLALPGATCPVVFAIRKPFTREGLRKALRDAGLTRGGGG